jgi:hypothetical protein
MKNHGKDMKHELPHFTRKNDFELRNTINAKLIH